MYDLITILLGILGMFVIVGGIAYWLQNRAAKQGNLFTQPASRPQRVLAFMLGLVFAAVFVFEISSYDKFHVVMPLLAVLLFAYSLGFNRLIKIVQRRDK
jgi:hypothetical protein